MRIWKPLQLKVNIYIYIASIHNVCTVCVVLVLVYYVIVIGTYNIKK